MELRSLVATYLTNLDSFAFKSTMMRDVEDTKTDAVQMGFPVAERGVKLKFFFFIKMTVIFMVHHGVKEYFIHENFECLNLSEVLKNELAEKVGKNPSLAKRVSDITIYSKASGNIVQNESTIESNASLDLSWMACQDDFTTKKERTRD